MALSFFLLQKQKKDAKKSSPKSKRLCTLLLHPADFGRQASCILFASVFFKALTFLLLFSSRQKVGASERSRIELLNVQVS